MKIGQKSAPELGAFFLFLASLQIFIFPFKIGQKSCFVMRTLPKLTKCWLQLGLKAKRHIVSAVLFRVEKRQYSVESQIFHRVSRQYWQQRLGSLWYIPGKVLPVLVSTGVADRNLSSTELESGIALGAFLQTPAPVLDKISGPMGAQFLYSTGLRFGTLMEKAEFFPVPALDKNRSPMVLRPDASTPAMLQNEPPSKHGKSMQVHTAALRFSRGVLKCGRCASQEARGLKGGSCHSIVVRLFSA